MRHPYRIVVTALLIALGLSLSALPATAASSTPDCATLAGSTSGLTLSSPTSTSTTMTAGSSLELLATWDTPTWAEKATMWICSTPNGAFNPSAPAGFAVVSQDGSFSTTLAVPADLAPGTDLCVHGVLDGHRNDGTPATEASNALCFRTAATSQPITTSTTATTAAPSTTTTTIALTTAGTIPPPAGPVTVLPAVASAPPPRPELPRTGRSLDVLSVVGAAAIAIGSVLRLGGNRPLTTISHARAPGQQ